MADCSYTRVMEFRSLSLSKAAKFHNRSEAKKSKMMAPTPFVQKIADKIVDLKLTVPAILLLEAHKPLAFLGSQLLLVAQPTFDLFFPKNFTGSLAELLAEPHQLEQLIRSLERQSRSPEISISPKEKGHD